MASSSSSSKPPSNSNTLDSTYDVFISFRGSDTRLNFTSHLHTKLIDKGIKAYLDSVDLDRGSIIEDTLWKAIEESMISVVILSNDYGNSPWCLDELVKIVDCAKNRGQIVLPVFYDVDPSVVTDQTGIYKLFFDDHEKHHSKDKVKTWKDALSFAGNLSGWDVRGRKMDEWDAAINDEEIWRDTMSKLRLGYEGLGQKEKQIFLDIACCLNGEEIERVERILDACGFHAKLWINTLIEKSFLRVEKSSRYLWTARKYSPNRVQMHELLRALGRNIVKGESLDHPGQRSRLWDLHDIRSIVQFGEVTTDKVDVIVLKEKRALLFPMKIGVFRQPFSPMRNLRILILHVEIRFPQLPFNYRPQIFIPHHELRVLEWVYYDGEYLPSDFYPVNLVELHLCVTKLKRLWRAFEKFTLFNISTRSSSDKYLYALKILNLSSNGDLIETPDFMYMPNLEELHFSDCKKLMTIHPSYQNLEKLIKLLLDGCSNLTELPTHNFHKLRNLVVFSLSRSSKINKFPNIRGPMPKLRYFDMMGTAIEAVPDSIKNLTGLTNLILKRCTELCNISRNINSLKSLKLLVLKECPYIERLCIEEICRSFNVPDGQWGFDIREEDMKGYFGIEYGYYRQPDW